MAESEYSRPTEGKDLPKLRPPFRSAEDGGADIIDGGAGVEGERGDEEEHIDLGYLMGILSRQQLEMVLAKFIMVHPESDHLLLEACSNIEVTEEELAEELQLDPEMASPLEVAAAAQDAVTRANNFALAKDCFNAMVILEYVTEALMQALGLQQQERRRRKQTQPRRAQQNNEDDEEREVITLFVQRLELVWEQALNLLAKRAEEQPAKFVDRLQSLFETLASWRLQLQPDFGPMFSDPLRVLKKSLKRLLAAPASASSGRASGQKRKGVSAAGSGSIAADAGAAAVKGRPAKRPKA